MNNDKIIGENIFSIILEGNKRSICYKLLKVERVISFWHCQKFRNQLAKQYLLNAYSIPISVQDAAGRYDSVDRILYSLG